MADAQPTLRERIDVDEGLKSKRNALIWVSLVLLTVTFTGAVIKEANTFILKIEFMQGEAISILLLLAIGFLGIRYYSYARKYHKELTKLWKKDFFRDDLILIEDYQTREPSGLLVNLSPKGFERDYPNLGHPELQSDWDWFYETKWLFFRYFVYEETNTHVGETVRVERVNLFAKSFRGYLIVLMIEFRCQLSGYYKYPENLDIQAPYFISLFAMLSLVFQAELSIVLNWILT